MTMPARCSAVEWAAWAGKELFVLWALHVCGMGSEEEIRKERATAAAQALGTEPWLCCTFENSGSRMRCGCHF